MRAKKTEHQGGDHAVRVVPISFELRAILADAFEQVEPGATEIVPMALRTGVKLRTHLERIITKAGATSRRDRSRPDRQHGMERRGGAQS